MSSFFGSRELNSRTGLRLATEDHLWDFLAESTVRTQVKNPALSRIEAATEPGPLLFRGQVQESFGISSSLYRFIQDETQIGVSESLLFEIEQKIIEVAKSRGLGKGMPDGHLLMLLQHYGIPTRLIDVSTGPLEALYFATEHRDASDGRLFIFKLIDRDGWVSRRDLDGTELPWVKKPGSYWTEEVSVVEPLALDPRMGAQGSKFLVGGIIRASADRNIQYGEHNNFLDKDELPQITTLSICFPKRSPGVVRTPWHAIGWSVRIPAAWKASLRERLAGVGISRDSMYPPFASVQWAATAAARDYISSL
ncbi:FRG domain-containing protein [Cryobacterium sp. TMT2-17-1]|uniref:FRG domain-containing protein n=1 Tax=Cryobacterium sp. TMT2-17-1 TaxID=1259248 RepID=UPI00141A78A6|nr:FRG domain-containing protein [Cryobacterium sp. TMT2-17-1]